MHRLRAGRAGCAAPTIRHARDACARGSTSQLTPRHLPPDTAASRSAPSEQQREQQRQQRLAELRRQFVDGPVLLFPGAGGAQFNSIGAVSMPGVGTVYFGPYNA